jgi:hypothetical protein
MTAEGTVGAPTCLVIFFLFYQVQQGRAWSRNYKSPSSSSSSPSSSSHTRFRILDNFLDNFLSIIDKFFDNFVSRFFV